MRFSRRRQRARAEEADDEAETRAAAWFQVARWVLPGPQFRWDHGQEELRPYRGFRRGRGRVRPDPTGYGEPTSPDREQWAEPRADDPTLDPILGDSDDEPWTP